MKKIRLNFIHFHEGKRFEPGQVIALPDDAADYVLAQKLEVKTEDKRTVMAPAAELAEADAVAVND